VGRGGAAEILELVVGHPDVVLIFAGGGFQTHTDLYGQSNT
jgi:hypothetical protein